MIVGYARVSTDGQSLEAQVSALSPGVSFPALLAMKASSIAPGSAGAAREDHMPSNIILTTDRLLLRPHTPEDFPHVAALWRDEAVVRWIGSGTPSTEEEAWARLLRYIGHWPALGFGYFAVFAKADNAFLGDVGLADHKRAITPPLDGMAEAGWVMARSAWGRGIATEAVGAVLAWYERQVAARPVACIIGVGHEASIHVARKCGFADWCEATYRDRQTLLFKREGA